MARVEGLHWATSAASVETTLLRRAGVMAVQANAANQTATVSYDPTRTSVAELSKWVRDCGFHCAGRSVPEHVCDPMSEPAEPGAGAPAPEPLAGDGGHAGMSMDHMAGDMRDRFLVRRRGSVVATPVLLCGDRTC